MTTLAACKQCRRQYDVSGMKAGEHVRCFCGELVEVPAARAREARVVHCSACGGKLRDGTARCDYCGGAVALADRRLGPACPECLARLPAGARFCQGCGVEIRPEKIQAIRLDARCPRCQGGLARTESEAGSTTECTSCGGLWLEESVFERLVSSRDGTPAGKLTPKKEARPAAAAADVARDVRYLPCPVCGGLMNRKNFGSVSGVVIDWCKGHGFWFDAEELERILAFVKAGGLDRSRSREIARLEERLRQAEQRAKTMGRNPDHAKTYLWAEEPRRTGPLLRALVDAVGGSLLRFWKD